MSRIQRHIGSASLQHGRDGNRHLNGAVETYGHSITGAHAAQRQKTGELVRALINVAIAKGLFPNGECLGVRIPGSGALEQLVQAGVAVMVDARVVPDIEEYAILSRGSHRQFPDRSSFVGQDAVQNLYKLFVNPLDRGVVEQVRCVFICPKQAALMDSHVQLKIEPGNLRFWANEGAFKAFKPRRLHREIMQPEHNLVDWCMVKRASGIYRLDHHIER